MDLRRPKALPGRLARVVDPRAHVEALARADPLRRVDGLPTRGVPVALDERARTEQPNHRSGVERLLDRRVVRELRALRRREVARPRSEAAAVALDDQLGGPPRNVGRRVAPPGLAGLERDLSRFARRELERLLVTAQRQANAAAGRRLEAHQGLFEQRLLGQHQELHPIGARDHEARALRQPLVLTPDDPQVAQVGCVVPGDVAQRELERQDAQREVTRVRLERRLRHAGSERRQQQRSDQQTRGREADGCEPRRTDRGDEEEEGGHDVDVVPVAHEATAAVPVPGDEDQEVGGDSAEREQQEAALERASEAGEEQERERDERKVGKQAGVSPPQEVADVLDQLAPVDLGHAQQPAEAVGRRRRRRHRIRGLCRCGGSRGSRRHSASGAGFPCIGRDLVVDWHGGEASARAGARQRGSGRARRSRLLSLGGARLGHRRHDCSGQLARAAQRHALARRGAEVRRRVAGERGREAGEHGERERAAGSPGERRPQPFERAARAQERRDHHRQREREQHRLVGRRDREQCARQHEPRDSWAAHGARRVAGEPRRVGRLALGDRQAEEQSCPDAERVEHLGLEPEHVGEKRAREEEARREQRREPWFVGAGQVAGAEQYERAEQQRVERDHAVRAERGDPRRREERIGERLAIDRGAPSVVAQQDDVARRPEVEVVEQALAVFRGKAQVTVVDQALRHQVVRRLVGLERRRQPWLAERERQQHQEQADRDQRQRHAARHGAMLRHSRRVIPWSRARRSFDSPRAACRSRLPRARAPRGGVSASARGKRRWRACARDRGTAAPPLPRHRRHPARGPHEPPRVRPRDHAPARRIAGARQRSSSARSPSGRRPAPSFASLLTGRYPQSTGLTHKAALRVPETSSLLPEVLRAHGFTTVAVGVEPRAVARSRLGRGFDEYVETWGASTSPTTRPRSAGALGAAGSTSWPCRCSTATPGATSDSSSGSTTPTRTRPTSCRRETPTRSSRTSSSRARRAPIAPVRNEAGKAIGDHDDLALLRRAVRRQRPRWSTAPSPRRSSSCSTASSGCSTTPLVIFTADHGESLGEHGSFVRARPAALQHHGARAAASSSAAGVPLGRASRRGRSSSSTSTRRSSNGCFPARKSPSGPFSRARACCRGWARGRRARRRRGERASRGRRPRRPSSRLRGRGSRSPPLPHGAGRALQGHLPPAARAGKRRPSTTGSSTTSKSIRSRPTISPPPIRAISRACAARSSSGCGSRPLRRPTLPRASRSCVLSRRSATSTRWRSRRRVAPMSRVRRGNSRAIARIRA